METSHKQPLRKPTLPEIFFQYFKSLLAISLKRNSRLHLSKLAILAGLSPGQFREEFHCTSLFDAEKNLKYLPVHLAVKERWMEAQTNKTPIGN